MWWGSSNKRGSGFLPTASERKGWVEQMRHVRIVGPSLAMLVLSAVICTSASATLPEWGRCVKLAKGKYANAGCTGEKVKHGGYEWERGTTAIAKRGFTSSGGEAQLRTTEGIGTHCTSETTTGELTGSKGIGNVEVTFQGCQVETLGLVCTGGEFEEGSFKQKPGEIKTRALKGTLGYIEGKGTTSPVVGISLTPEAKKGLFAQFICGGVLVVRVGTKPKQGGGDSIISPITPINTMGNTAVQTYTQQQECEEGTCHATGVQIPTSFEGGKPDVLETEISDNFAEIEWAQSGQTLTTTNTLEEEVEIKA
jgi:hypothetical protein